uniref:Uncharacterized protein n=1 Tax=Arundo donax TaxID=35708 RepID=A0A0A9D784_ARUDO
MTSSETQKIPLVKQNGSCSTKGNAPLLLSNGKTASGPHIKPIHLKNSATEKFKSNGKVNLTSRNNLEVNESATLSESNGCKTGKPAEPSKKIANGTISCKKMDDNSERISQDANGNGHPTCFQHLVETSNAKATCAQQYSKQSSSAVASESSVLYREEAANSVKDGMTSSAKNSGSLKRPLEEEKLKDMLAESANSHLRSSVWVDDVCNFMRSEKRQCIQNTDKPRDIDAMRKQLVDSVTVFRSKIPEPLMKQLIQRLRLYFESKL